MRMTRRIRAQEIADALGAKLFGEDLEISSVRELHALREGCVSYLPEYSETHLKCIEACPHTLILCPDAPDRERVKAARIISDHPRLDLLYVIKQFFAPDEIVGIDRTAVVCEGAVIGKNVSIGAHSWIGRDVRIGEHTTIRHQVVIDGKTTIGSHCMVKSSAVIGEQGFAFEHDEFGVPEKYPNIGDILIGDHVWIGSGSTIERASLGETVIGNHVKIDDCVQIGSNTVIGDSTMIMAGSVICGQTKLGKHCWISPKSVIKEQLTIEGGSMVGLGSVVIDDVPENVVVAGNPAKILKRTSS